MINIRASGNLGSQRLEKPLRTPVAAPPHHSPQSTFNRWHPEVPAVHSEALAGEEPTKQ